MSGGLSGDGAILARWPGRCPYCAKPIERGDLIVKVAGQWLHHECPESDGLVPTDEVPAGPNEDEEAWAR